jgi:dihydrolipoamide dehydrogenase
MNQYDTIVIGGGPGGYVAAIRSAQLGRRTAVVERDKPGGRCLNYACIPAKTMLRTAELFHEARTGADLGVVATDVTLDWEALGRRRAAVSESLAAGVAGLWKKNEIDLIAGSAALDAAGDVVVGNTQYQASAVILATGSTAQTLPGVELGQRIVDTWGAWSLAAAPRRLAVVGAGASGCELASAYARFGTEVLLIEMADQILPAEDRDIAKVVERAFKRHGIEIATGSPVQDVTAGTDSIVLTYGDRSAEVDCLAIAGGRRPDVDGLGLAQAGVELEADGKLKVDAYGRTSNPKVYAIGDLVNRKALAHKASEEGVVAAERAAGVPTHPVDQELMVGATFCAPQVASVGLTEQAARDAGHDVRIGKQKIAGEGAGTIYGDRDGLVKLVVDDRYGQILGAHIVGNRACDMIAQLVTTMALEGGHQELARVVHPHPTISEAVLDAARAVDGWAVHA